MLVTKNTAFLATKSLQTSLVEFGENFKIGLLS